MSFAQKLVKWTLAVLLGCVFMLVGGQATAQHSAAERDESDKIRAGVRSASERQEQRSAQQWERER